MTPQEFFKNDIFATKAGIVLLEVRKGYMATIRASSSRARYSAR